MGQDRILSQDFVVEDNTYDDEKQERKEKMDKLTKHIRRRYNGREQGAK